MIPPALQRVFHDLRRPLLAEESAAVDLLPLATALARIEEYWREERSDYASLRPHETTHLQEAVSRIRSLIDRAGHPGHAHPEAKRALGLEIASLERKPPVWIRLLPSESVAPEDRAADASPGCRARCLESAIRRVLEATTGFPVTGLSRGESPPRSGRSVCLDLLEAGAGQVERARRTLSAQGFSVLVESLRSRPLFGAVAALSAAGEPATLILTRAAAARAARTPHEPGPR